LQCAQMKMLKPRPLQLAHTAPLGALPAQSRQVKTVRPPMQAVWSGSRFSDDIARYDSVLPRLRSTAMIVCFGTCGKKSKVEADCRHNCIPWSK
jgi:hypothetical protein